MVQAASGFLSCFVELVFIKNSLTPLHFPSTYTVYYLLQVFFYLVAHCDKIFAFNTSLCYFFFNLFITAKQKVKL